jgi:uncharacterized protein YbcI
MSGPTRQDGDVRDTSVLVSISNALVTLHKEQFGRGPTRARSHFAGPDALICIMEDALLPAEQSMVELGEARRVQETRVFFQNATADRFIEAVESRLHRKVRSFASATDPIAAVVTEIYIFHSSPA